MVIEIFVKELRALEKVNLPNKLLLFSLYEDLYKILVTKIDDNLKIEYGNFLTDTFINIINNFNEDSDSKTIMQEFIKRIKLNKYSNLDSLIKYINMFEINLDNILQIRNEASVIDNLKYSFKIKVILLEIYKKHLEIVIYNLNKFYDNNIVKVFGLKLVNKLNNKLENILSTGINYFKENLYLETKDIFIDSYYKKEFDFFKFKDFISEYFVLSLDDIEKEIFVDVIIDIIIDLDNSDFLERNSMLYFRNLASKYNISISEIIDKLEKQKTKKK